MEFVYQPPLDDPDIVFADDYFIIVNKNSGLLSVPGRKPEHQDCLFSRLQAIFPSVSCVHRLDMDTSGLMIWALDKEAHRKLSSQFENKMIEKEYVAVVDGLVHGDEGVIDAALRCDWPNRPLQMIDPVQGKHAMTKWQVTKRYSPDNKTQLLLRPKTGRSHQLRVHCLYMGHPILGDRFYGSSAVIAASPRLCLHASKLGFTHPVTGEEMAFQVPAKF